MARTVDYEARRKSILAAAIDRYISQVEPVSSEELSTQFGVSSATIRNIFKELEDSGYLTHPYTSAGRVPTVKGYRYYVDFLLSESQLKEQEKEQVTKEYREAVKNGDDVLEKSSEVLSYITHYAGIAAQDDQTKFFYRGIGFILEQPEFQDVNNMRLLIRMLEDKSQMLRIVSRDFTGKVKIYIGDELGCSGGENCSLAVTKYACRKKYAGRIAVLGPLRMTYSYIVPVLEYVSETLEEIYNED